MSTPFHYRKHERGSGWVTVSLTPAMVKVICKALEEWYGQLCNKSRGAAAAKELEQNLLSLALGETTKWPTLFLDGSDG